MTNAFTKIIGALLGMSIFFAVGVGLAHAGGSMEASSHQSRCDHTACGLR